MAKQNNNLPTIADLTTDVGVAFKNDQFNQLVNQQPPAKWIKTHPYIKGHRYLPIDKIEFLLKRIFKTYKIEVKETKMIMNSIQTAVRVHYIHPVSGQWEWHDGIGAAELQTEKDSGPLRADMSNVKKGAVPMATGISKSVAIKDACDHIGDLFGANLNRKEPISFSVDDSIEEKVAERVNVMLDKSETVSDLQELLENESVPAKYHDLIKAKIEYLESKGQNGTN